LFTKELASDLPHGRPAVHVGVPVAPLRRTAREILENPESPAGLDEGVDECRLRRSTLDEGVDVCRVRRDAVDASPRVRAINSRHIGRGSEARPWA
jgi:hypothetical protein